MEENENLINPLDYFASAKVDEGKFYRDVLNNKRYLMAFYKAGFIFDLNKLSKVKEYYDAHPDEIPSDIISFFRPSINFILSKTNFIPVRDEVFSFLVENTDIGGRYLFIDMKNLCKKCSITEDTYLRYSQKLAGFTNLILKANPHLKKSESIKLADMINDGDYKRKEREIQDSKGCLIEKIKYYPLDLIEKYYNKFSWSNIFDRYCTQDTYKLNIDFIENTADICGSYFTSKIVAFQKDDIQKILRIVKVKLARYSEYTLRDMAYFIRSKNRYNCIAFQKAEDLYRGFYANDLNRPNTKRHPLSTFIYYYAVVYQYRNLIDKDLWDLEKVREEAREHIKCVRALDEIVKSENVPFFKADVMTLLRIIERGDPIQLDESLTESYKNTLSLPFIAPIQILDGNKVEIY